MREISGYEDAYSGVEFEQFDDFWASCGHYWAEGSAVGHYNFPVWIERGEEDGRLYLGLFMQRHGVAAIWVTPCTDAQYKHVQDAISRVWIGKLDAGFPRHASYQRPFTP